jgi:hypothetical protein
MLSKPTEEYLPYYRRYTELEPDNFRTKELYQKYPELKASVNSLVIDRWTAGCG